MACYRVKFYSYKIKWKNVLPFGGPSVTNQVKVASPCFTLYRGGGGTKFPKLYKSKANVKGKTIKLQTWTGP
jgi:hypothetical protein